MRNDIILGIETSCDETSAALVRGGRHIVSNVIASQVPIHRRYNGVVPELASRAHIENINKVLEECFHKAQLTPADVTALACTRGPGLAGALLVGQVAAQTLSFLHGMPLVGVNHIEGHLYSALLASQKLNPPFLALVVSGGHTELIVVRDYGAYRYLGGTRDDAAGEAFDKVAKLLGLGYPGGPVIDRLSRDGDPAAVRFTRPYLRGSWDFSFSGIKTAVVNYVARASRGVSKADICASFQQAVVETVVEKTVLAARAFRMKTIVLGGGVSANTALRAAFKKAARREGFKVFLPPPVLCTDNAAMIACAGYYRYEAMIKGKRSAVSGAVPAEPIEPDLKLTNWKK